MMNKISTLVAVIAFCAACATKPTTEKNELPPADIAAIEEINEELPEAEFEEEAVKEAEPEYVWVNAPCSEFTLPKNDFKNLSCKKVNKNLFCAFFENGRPFYCSGRGGMFSHRLNQWGSSLTVEVKDFENRPFLIYYYANGKLARFEGIDYYENQGKDKIWFDENQIRVYQYDLNDKVEEKYYFPFNKPYIHYPGGNDMAEVNGEWELSEYGEILKDNKYFLTLPEQSVHTAPDTCKVFAGACQPSKPSK